MVLPTAELPLAATVAMLTVLEDQWVRPLLPHPAALASSAVSASSGIGRTDPAVRCRRVAAAS